MECAGLVRVRAPRKRDVMSEQLTENRERQRGQLFRQARIVDNCRGEALRSVGAVEQPDHCATVIKQTL